MVLAGRTKLRVSKNFFRGDIFLYLLNIFATAVPKLKIKNIKNFFFSSILAIVNHRNWLDDSPPLSIWGVPGEGCHLLNMPKYLLFRDLTLKTISSLTSDLKKLI